MVHATTPTPRQRLIDAAADLFYRHGIGAVGVDLVSETAGVSKRTLYREFGSKDQLVAQSLDATGPEIISLWLPPDTASEWPPRRQILTVFERLGAWTSSESFRGCPFINTACELADPGHPARRVALGYKRGLRDYFADRGARAGASDPTGLAEQLITVFDGLIVQAVMGIEVRADTVQAMVRALLDAQGAR